MLLSRATRAGGRHPARGRPRSTWGGACAIYPPRARLRASSPRPPTGFLPQRPLDALPNNLPVQLSSFIGRERELGELARLLADHGC